MSKTQISLMKKGKTHCTEAVVAKYVYVGAMCSMLMRADCTVLLI